MYGRELVLETDDWVDAEWAAHEALSRPGSDRRLLRVDGVHPTHQYSSRGWQATCLRCGAPDNGCYASHAPCGYVFDGSLVTALRREREARAQELIGA